MIATTIEQSRHLLELGIDPATADMWILRVTPYKHNNHDELVPDGEPFWGWALTRDVNYSLNTHEYFPAWSLSALLEVMPAHLKGWPADEDERLTLAKYHRKDADGPCYVINYSNPLNGSFAFPKLAQNPLDAAYEMVVWLLENGHIKKGGTHNENN